MPSEAQQWAARITEAVGTVIYGKDEVVEKLLVTLLCRGHALLEDVPGVGKTVLARGLSTVLGGEFRRIQCTPDLLPADVLGVSVYNANQGTFEFRQGPIVTNILLVDEINRATPRTQSALLEAMSERQISVEGKTQDLPDPFFMLATENPVEFEGTFPLPEAQRDRFFLTLRMGYPAEAAEHEIMMAQRRLTHPVSDLKPVTDLDTVRNLQRQVAAVEVGADLQELILDITDRTRNDPRLGYGASPRGSMALYQGAQALAAIRGRDAASAADIHELAPAVLLKRIGLKPEHLLKGLEVETVIDSILTEVGGGAAPAATSTAAELGDSAGDAAGTAGNAADAAADAAAETPATAPGASGSS